MVIEKKIELLVFELSASWQPEVEMLRELIARFKKISVLVIDGNNTEEAIVKAFHYGATDVFRKPYSKELLVERIGTLIQQQL